MSVGQPKVLLSQQNVSLAIGQQPYNLSVSTVDQSGGYRVVAAALAVRDSSTDSTVAKADSATLQVSARQSSTTVGISGLAKGATQIIFTAPGYMADTLVVAVDSGLDVELVRTRLAGEDDVENVTREAESAKEAGFDLL